MLYSGANGVFFYRSTITGSPSIYPYSVLRIIKRFRNKGPIILGRVNHAHAIDGGVIFLLRQNERFWNYIAACLPLI